MTNRRSQARDLTESVATAELFNRLESLFAALPARESAVIRLRYGLEDSIPRTHAEIGRIFNIPIAHVRKIESKALSKMRHPSWSIMLTGYDEATPVPAVLDRLRQRRAAIARCARHGWIEWPFGEEGLICEQCVCPLPESASTGRPSRYCSNACRQADYRQRRRGEGDDRTRRMRRRIRFGSAIVAFRN